MKNSNDTIGNRTRDLSACSAVPQPTAPPHAPCTIIVPTNAQLISVYLCAYVGTVIVYLYSNNVRIVDRIRFIFNCPLKIILMVI